MRLVARTAHRQYNKVQGNPEGHGSHSFFAMQPESSPFVSICHFDRASPMRDNSAGTDKLLSIRWVCNTIALADAHCSLLARKEPSTSETTFLLVFPDAAIQTLQKSQILN